MAEEKGKAESSGIVSPVEMFTRFMLTGNPAIGADFQQWSWLPGMGFLDSNLWWGTQKQRLTPHEGVDFVQYLDTSDHIRHLDSGLMIQSILAGEIVQVHRDFLAWSLYIRHPQFVVAGRVLHTVFAHLHPRQKALGRQVIASEEIGTLEQYSQSRVPLHLHFTVAWISGQVDPGQFSWRLLGNPEHVTLVNPNRPILPNA